MGLDCNLISKLKDGTYICVSLDRYYVFQDIDGDDAELIDNFDLADATSWYNTRMQAIRKLRSAKDRDYHKYWATKMVEGLASIYRIYPNNVEWSMICDENSEIYEQVLLGFHGGEDFVVKELITNGSLVDYSHKSLDVYGG